MQHIYRARPISGSHLVERILGERAVVDKVVRFGWLVCWAITEKKPINISYVPSRTSCLLMIHTILKTLVDNNFEYENVDVSQVFKKHIRREFANGYSCEVGERELG